jgi:hypothetical protein
MRARAVLLACVLGAPALAKPPSLEARTVDHLADACNHGLEEVRAIIDPAGVSIDVTTYSGHGESATPDRRRLRPRELDDERAICHVFDGRTTANWSVRCAAETDGVACEIKNDPDRFTLRFRGHPKTARLVALTGYVDN